MKDEWEATRLTGVQSREALPPLAEGTAHAKMWGDRMVAGNEVVPKGISS